MWRTIVKPKVFEKWELSWSVFAYAADATQQIQFPEKQWRDVLRMQAIETSSGAAIVR